MEITVPDNIEDFPAAIEQATVCLSDLTQKLERFRRRERDLKTEFKMEAREADGPSNRTERKAYVKDRKENSEVYQEILEEIKTLTRKQAHAEGRLKRLEGEFEVRLRQMKGRQSLQERLHQASSTP